MTRHIPSALCVFCLLLVATQAPAVESDFDSAGVKIHYETKGSGEPVVLLHGFLGNIPIQWGQLGVIEKLAANYKVIAMDSRGHGKSGKPHEADKYGPEMANDVVRLLDHLKIAKAHVVGYSMGSFMASYLTMNHPDRVISVTLGGAGWHQDGDELSNSTNLIADALEGGKGIGPLIEALTPAGQPKPTAEQIQAMNQLLLLSNDTKALAACIRGNPKMTVREAQLKGNHVPMLCLIGENDPARAAVDNLVKVTPDVKVVVLPGADHMSAFQQPRFIDELQSFLSSHNKATVPAGAR